MVNFTRLRLVKFIPISNTTLVIFIPNFTATHAITSTNGTNSIANRRIQLQTGRIQLQQRRTQLQTGRIQLQSRRIQLQKPV